ncbi:Stk1 family PASTA domain-containing Ser/Thr kinase [Arcanobacterium bovis]|uniref:non-specific serine/threonine protein kinase n=1 Tax=Arcanobacterium bovis TaxID=2529275 RepID=A0A4Q9V2N4_9ACTO|nr:Stk1 family PASTA domain-containing Ser/Thr kinase [Arcanobacterium bovis]TBW22838.1 Stk1 family PASTA domain-containing Ser/Thr kinase [Arcanobacterium bovis]
MNVSDPILGTVIENRYVIQARLARGGMASVYRATDSRLGRDVAIKFIHPHLAEQDALTQRFIKEARAAASLYSPHIVAVYDQGVAHLADGARAYLVMELVPGPNLRKQFSELGSFTLGQAFDIIKQILVALCVAHEKGIVHRDVKPENILLSDSFDHTHHLNTSGITAKVGDFGLAKAVTDSSSAHTTSMLGTVGYIAPEIVSHGKIGPASDIYSAGIMLYELLAGRQPFTGNSPLAIAYSHVNDPVPRLHEQAEWIPVAVDSLISLFTAKDPHRRPQTGAAALDALTDVYEAIPEELLIRRIPVFPVQKETEAPQEVQAPTSSPTRAFAATEIFTSSDDDAPEETHAPLAATGLLPEEFKPELTANSSTNGADSDTGTKPPVKKRHRWPLILGLLALIACAAGFGVHWWFTAGPGLRVQVINVAGQPEQDAVANLKKAGFSPKTSHAFSDTVAKGYAIATDPQSGAKIHPSTTVTVIISDGVEMLTVPNVVSQPQNQAEATLRSARFSPTITQTWSDTVEKGKVVSQEPAAGSSVPHDSEVKIAISQGREPVKVPNVTGKDTAQAQDMLTKAGLKANISEDNSPTVPKGQVMSQDPGNGTTLYRNDTVNLVVSKGPQLVQVPDVFGKQEKEAITILKNAGFQVEVERILFGVFGTVRAQNPGAGEMVLPGSTIKLKVV